MATSQVPSNILKNIYLFKGFTDSELGMINKIVEEKTYSAGQDIFIIGQDATSFYVIRMGTVKIYKNPDGSSDINIAKMGTGAHFGELPLMDGGKRSATAQATETSTVLEVNYDKLKKLLGTNHELAHKFYKELAHFMAARLRATTENLKHIQEVRLKHF
jgi:CRP/FNR family transcriptional regulator, cyclic AMP receptor protein